MLEFNPPVHGAWNIVHIGMAVPEAHQIYVCAENCMRGVVMTALEMGAGDRFSCVTLSERDFLRDNLETVTVEGVSEVMRRLKKTPPLVLLFTVCVHRMLSCDLDYVYKILAKRFPQTRFVRCFMDPIAQKEGPTPEEKLREAMFSPILPLPVQEKTVSLLGGDFPQKQASSDIAAVLPMLGYRLCQLSDCRTFRDFQRLGESGAFLATYPTGEAGVRTLARRLKRGFLFLPETFLFPSIDEASDSLTAFLPLSEKEKETAGVFFRERKAAAEAALCRLSKRLKGTPVVVDYTAVSRPVSLAALLLSHGIDVRALFTDQCRAEEKALLGQLTEAYPRLAVLPTVHPSFRREQTRRRQRESWGGGNVLAVGQKAAWMAETPYFVNMVEGNGGWGYTGIAALCREMAAALTEKKDLHRILPRKGVGCACVIS